MVYKKDSKKIAKNTFLLYIRMFVLMFVNLYTSRIVLRFLGVEDFGLYGILGSVVVLFSFFNGVMSNATSRFLSFSIGRGNGENVKKTFVASVNVHVFLALVILFFAETIGLYVVNQILTIPPEKFVIANVVYQFTLMTFVANLLRIPYNAAIISYEKMNFYAYLSIADVVVRLGLLMLLFVIPGERLILYAVMLTTNAVLMTGIFYFYCKRKFENIQYIRKICNNSDYKEILHFSGWSVFSALSNMMSNTGINMLINVFCGLTLNAAVSIANQVSNAMYQFVSNFQTAFKPAIVKLYATEDYEECYKTVVQTSKFSFALFWTLVLPIVIAMSEVLDIWLGDVPEMAAEFTMLVIIYLVVDATCQPVIDVINATGKIKIPQIICGSLILLNFPIGWMLLKIGCVPYMIWIVRIGLNVLSNVVRLLYVRRVAVFPIGLFAKKVVVPALVVIVVSASLNIYIYEFFPRSLVGLALFAFVSIGINIPLICLILLSRTERGLITQYIQSRIKRR